MHVIEASSSSSSLSSSPPHDGSVTKRERRRQPRTTRAARVDAMRATLAALERAMPVMLTLGDGTDNDTTDRIHWDGFLDTHALRVRNLMRQSLQLTTEAQQLRLTQSHVRRLLREYEVASRVLAGLLRDAPEGDWEQDVTRWRMLTYQFFTPWTLDACVAEANKTLEEMHTLLSSVHTQSTGLSFCGWRDRRRMDPITQSLQFVFEKEFHGFDMRAYVDQLWAAYTTTELYQRVIVGDRAVGAVDVVQKLSPTVWIVRHDERYPSMPMDAHALHLICRFETERGFTSCIRSLPSPTLCRAIDGPRDVWATASVWQRWEALGTTDSPNESRESRDFKLSIGGTMAGTDQDFVNRWLLESLATVVRAELAITRRRMLPMEWANDNTASMTT